MSLILEARIICTHPSHDVTFVTGPKIYLDEEFAVRDMNYGYGELFSVSLSEDTSQGWPCKGAWVDDIYLTEVAS